MNGLFWNVSHGLGPDLLSGEVVDGDCAPDIGVERELWKKNFKNNQDQKIVTTFNARYSNRKIWFSIECLWLSETPSHLGLKCVRNVIF